MGLPLRSERRRRFLLGLALAQVVFGGLGVAIGVRIDSLFLICAAVFVGIWFWIPLAAAARDKPLARKRLGWGLVAASAGVGITMVVASTLVPELAMGVVPGIGLVGILCLVLPLALAWMMARDLTPQQQAALRAWGGRQGTSKTVDGLRLGVEVLPDPAGVGVVIEVDAPKYHGQLAVLEVYRLADVHDSRPVNDLRVLLEREVRLDRQRIEVRLPAAVLRGFTYAGTKVSVKTLAELRLADGVLWDTTVRTEVPVPECRRPAATGDAATLADPKDCFSLVGNVMALPLPRRAATLALFGVGSVVIAVNSLVAFHDETAPPGGTYIYVRRESDGDTRSPLLDSLLLSGSTGVGVWLGIRRQLRSYMTFRIARPPGPIGRDTVIPMAGLVQGQPAVDLEDVTVRVVAYNLEKGAYKRGSGSSERTVSFAEPVRAVVLFEQVLPLVPRGQPLERFLTGDVAFAPVFDRLYPPVELSKTHGLFLQWEAQLLHDGLVDQEVIPATCEFNAADFAPGDSAEPEAARA